MTAAETRIFSTYSKNKKNYYSYNCYPLCNQSIGTTFSCLIKGKNIAGPIVHPVIIHGR